jgi:hypothetical protein
MPAAASSKDASLEATYDSLHQLLSRYSPPLKTKSGTVRGKKDFHLVIPKAVVVPGAYEGKPVEVGLAAIILQKGYVGFYFMPIYVEPGLKKKLSPSLTKLLKGKTCFYIKKLDDDLLKHIESALDEGVKCYKGRGWL